MRRRLSSSRPSVIGSPEQREVEGHEDGQVQGEPRRADGRDRLRRDLGEEPDALREEEAERRSRCRTYDCTETVARIAAKPANETRRKTSHGPMSDRHMRIRTKILCVQLSKRVRSGLR